MAAEEALNGLVMELSKWRKPLELQPDLAIYNSGESPTLRYIGCLLIHHSTEHHYNRPIDRYTPLAQLLMVIALIYYIIMGVSQHNAEFILGALTLCVNVFCSPNSKSTAPQIPSTLDTLLSKF
jgi:hypothetical protein